VVYGVTFVISTTSHGHLCGKVVRHCKNVNGLFTPGQMVPTHWIRGNYNNSNTMRTVHSVQSLGTSRTTGIQFPAGQIFFFPPNSDRVSWVLATVFPGVRLPEHMATGLLLVPHSSSWCVV
jgi:hypothetical protein